eukprot:g25710.t1
MPKGKTGCCKNFLENYVAPLSCDIWKRSLSLFYRIFSGTTTRNAHNPQTTKKAYPAVLPAPTCLEMDRTADRCAICLSKILHPASPNSCLHEFCFKCLLGWSKVSTTCPSCRMRFNQIHAREPGEDWTYVEVEEKIQSRAGLPVLTSPSCLLCGSSRDEQIMLRCDGCMGAYHGYCLTPPQQGQPPGLWFCPTCPTELLGREGYGGGHATLQDENSAGMVLVGVSTRSRTRHIKKRHKQSAEFLSLPAHAAKKCKRSGGKKRLPPFTSNRRRSVSPSSSCASSGSSGSEHASSSPPSLQPRLLPLRSARWRRKRHNTSPKMHSLPLSHRHPNLNLNCNNLQLAGTNGMGQISPTGCSAWEGKSSDDKERDRLMGAYIGSGMGPVSSALAHAHAYGSSADVEETGCLDPGSPNLQAHILPHSYYGRGHSPTPPYHTRAVTAAERREREEHLLYPSCSSSSSSSSSTAPFSSATPPCASNGSSYLPSASFSSSAWSFSSPRQVNLDSKLTSKLRALESASDLEATTSSASSANSLDSWASSHSHAAHSHTTHSHSATSHHPPQISGTCGATHRGLGTRNASTAYNPNFRRARAGAHSQARDQYR